MTRASFINTACICNERYAFPKFTFVHLIYINTYSSHTSKKLCLQAALFSLVQCSIISFTA